MASTSSRALLAWNCASANKPVEPEELNGAFQKERAVFILRHLMTMRPSTPVFTDLIFSRYLMTSLIISGPSWPGTSSRTLSKAS